MAAKLESLEERAVPATITVTSTADDSNPGTLRDAIQQVNFGNFDTIAFDFPGADHTITPTLPLPRITRPVSINPTLQTVVLSGQSAGDDADGLFLDAGSDGSTIRGLVIGDFSRAGIEITSNNNVIELNKLGTDEAGNAAAPNGFGLLIQPGSGNRIGGTGAGNVMSGNRFDGLRITGASSAPAFNLVVGNRIGTNAAGTAALPNAQRGIVLYDAAGNVIGGDVAGLGNLISGNTLDGISLAGSSSNVVIGNLVGTDVTGLGAIPNGFAGVTLTADNAGQGSANNRIGGAGFDDRNIISGNVGNGIYASGPGTVANLIQGNWIGPNLLSQAPHGNGGNGIFLDGAGGNFIGTDSGDSGTPGLRNIISGNALDGILIRGGGGDVVANNYIGVEVGGRFVQANGGDGIALIPDSLGNGPRNNRIGGLDPSLRNVISGNLNSGISFTGESTTANVVQGNFIGLDRFGTTAVGNIGRGIDLESPGNFIGTDASGNAVAGARNVIAGNQNGNLWLAFADNTVIGGNFVGTDASGTSPIGDGISGITLNNTNNVRIGSPLGLSDPSLAGVAAANGWYGISLVDSTHVLITGYFIGTDPSEKVVMGNLGGILMSDRSSDNVVGVIGPNAILFNTFSGVAIQGDTSLRNTVAGNRMVNFGPSIDLGGDGVTPNHPGGPIGGPNGFTNAPVLTFAANGNLGVILNAAPSTAYRIDYYASDPAGFAFGPQAQFPLGTAIVTTDANGNASAVVPYTPVADASIFSATATDSSGNTSELSGSPDPVGPIAIVGADASLTVAEAANPVVAYFIDLDPRASTDSSDRFSSSVDWGDGSPASAGAVVPVVGGFAVLAPHTYTRPGIYTVTAFVTDRTLAFSVAATSIAQATQPLIYATGRDYTFLGRSRAFSNVVATFADAGPLLTPASYRAVVSWGDGTSSVGKITASGGTFVVRANHRFKRFAGTRQVAVTISDTSGRQAIAIDHVAFRRRAR